MLPHARAKRVGTDAADLAHFKTEFFKALAHPLRIRIIDALRDGETGVNDLCEKLQVEQSTVSQQLAQLRGRNIVAGRKEGQNVYYSIRDTAVFRLLDVAREIFNNQLVSVQGMLAQLGNTGATPPVMQRQGGKRRGEI